MEKYDLDTPCIVLDLDILEQNLDRMQTGAAAAGKNLRPHAKSHKCSTLARKQLEQGAIGICAAKVSEAEVLVKDGVHGVLVTGPVASEPVVAVMLIADELSAAGATANVAGFGVGGSMSGAGSVVADAGADEVPVLPRLSRMVTV